MAIFGLSAPTGWVIAALLGALALTAVGVISFEVRNAIDIPDDVDLESAKWVGARSNFGGKSLRGEVMGWPAPVDSNPVMARTVETPVTRY